VLNDELKGEWKRGKTMLKWAIANFEIAFPLAFFLIHFSNQNSEFRIA
jgi:hypothetical protein